MTNDHVNGNLRKCQGKLFYNGRNIDNIANQPVAYDEYAFHVIFINNKIEEFVFSIHNDLHGEILILIFLLQNGNFY